MDMELVSYAPAAQQAAAQAAAEPVTVDGVWTGNALRTAAGFNCPTVGAYSITIADGDITGTIEWQGFSSASEVTGWVSSDDTVNIVYIPKSGSLPRRGNFAIRMQKGQLVGREIADCTYNVTLSRKP